MLPLPPEFQGVRSCDEARDDVLVIASAADPLNQVRVLVDPDDGAATEARGALTYSEGQGGAIELLLDTEPPFEFLANGCRGAWLDTNDGTDYYGLSVDLGWGCVELSDGYNDRYKR
jgi:hypothetical protein